MKLIRWINASAGTGKTHKIKELIENLVNSGVNPESILCLTFTTAGAMEMKHRFLQANLGHKIPRFETIHSFSKSLCGNDCEIMNEDTTNNLLQEAIELVLLEPIWENFFESVYDSWASIISDVKQIILSGLPVKDVFLKNYITKNCITEKITLSSEAIKALNKAGLNSLMAKILSNNLELYAANFVTKTLKLSKKILPKSFYENPDYVEVNEELQKVFENIFRYVLDYSNSDYLRQSLTCNVFIREVSNAYQNLKKHSNLIDFNDMIQLGIQKLKDSPEPIMHIRHIFLDEAQDTSESQWKLLYGMVLEILQLEDSSFTVVGDRKQIIYQFNGASKTLYGKIKLNLETSIKALNGTWQELDLDKSYRTSQTILSFIDSVMEGTSYPCQHTAAIQRSGYIKTWLPVKNSKDHLAINKGWTVPDKQNIPQWISLCIEEIGAIIGKKKLLNEDRFAEPDDITILVPRRYIHNFILIEQLKQAQIPIKNSIFGMVSDETVQDLLSVASIVIDVRNDLMVVNILKNMYFGWTNKEVEDLVINRDDTVWAVMLHSIEDKVVKAVKTIEEWIDFPRDLVSFYAKLIFHTDFGKCLLENFHSETLAFWEKVMSLSKMSLSEFVFYMQNSYEPFNLNRKGVSILTTHASKGKEFNIVFLCNSHLSINKNQITQVIYENIFLLRGNYELYKNARNKLMMEQENESDRLLYVALTRAREQLYILPPLSTDNLNPKSWYSKIIKNIHMFEKNDEEAYELKDSYGDKKTKTHAGF